MSLADGMYTYGEYGLQIYHTPTVDLKGVLAALAEEATEPGDKTRIFTQRSYDGRLCLSALSVEVLEQTPGGGHDRAVHMMGNALERAGISPLIVQAVRDRKKGSFPLTFTDER